MLEILFFIAVYVLTVVLWFLVYAYDLRNRCYTIGDVFDNMEGFLFVPILNTIIGIGFCLCFILGSIGIFIWKKLKLNKLWEKVRNIEIKR